MSEWIPRTPSVVDLGVRHIDPITEKPWSWALMKGADARWRRVRTKWAEYTNGDEPSLTPDGLWGDYISGEDLTPALRGFSGRTEGDQGDGLYDWGEGMLNEPFVDGSMTATTPIPGSSSVIEHGDNASLAWTTGDAGAFAGRELPRPGASAHALERHGSYVPLGRPELVEIREVESTIAMTHVYWDATGNYIGEPAISRDGIPVPDGYRVEYADDAAWLDDEWSWEVEITHDASAINRVPLADADAAQIYRCLLYIQDGPAGVRQRMPHPLSKTASSHYNDAYPPNWPLSMFPALRWRADNTDPEQNFLDIAAWPFGQVVFDGILGVPGSGKFTTTVKFTTPGVIDPHYITGAEATFGALSGIQQTGKLLVPTGWAGRQESTVTTRILSVTRLRQHASYRFVKDTAGQYRLRQRQTSTGTDSWPLRQRQNGAHSGSWPLRQRQTGV